jgi:hypothetical protein
LFFTDYVHSGAYGVSTSFRYALASRSYIVEPFGLRHVSWNCDVGFGSFPLRSIILPAAIHATGLLWQPSAEHGKRFCCGTLPLIPHTVVVETVGVVFAYIVRGCV